MNKLCCVIIMFITYGVCKAQNLVQNGDFEQYSGCPNDVAQIDSALFWMNPAKYPGLGGTPDYFNQCTNSNLIDVPQNTFGYQQALSGSGYAGLVTFSNVTWQANFREYIEGELLTPLTANQCYHFEMYVNLANESDFTTEDIGAYFLDSVVIGIDNWLPLPFSPQINNATGLITDTLNWVLVSGNYAATGGENYLIIGNFNDDFNTNTTSVNTGGYPISYIFIDNVSLTPCTGIEEENSNSDIKVYPNPITDKLNIKNNSNELSEIILYDFASRKLLQLKFTNTVTLNTEQLAKGIYLYEVRNKNGVIKKGKVVKD